jgi:hypothetical protein
LALAWAEELLARSTSPPQADLLDELTLPLSALGTLARLCPEDEAWPRARGRAVASAIATLLLEADTPGDDALLLARAEAFVALGGSGLPLDTSDPRHRTLLGQLWTSWALTPGAFSDETFVRVLRAGVSLGYYLHEAVAHGGGARVVDLGVVKRTLGDTPLERYVELRILYARGRETAGLGSVESLARRMLERVVEAESHRLDPVNFADALLFATRGGTSEERRAELLERALAQAPEHPWIQLKAAIGLSKASDPRASDLALEAYEGFREGGYESSLETSPDRFWFLEASFLVHARARRFARARGLLTLMAQIDYTGQDVVRLLEFTHEALNDREAEAALGLIDLAEERLTALGERAWGSQAQKAFRDLAASLDTCYREGLRLSVGAGRPDLAKALIERYRDTGRLEGNEEFRKLAAKVR